MQDGSPGKYKYSDIIETCTPFNYQVAGHVFSKSRIRKVGIVKSPEGFLMKFIQEPPKGPRELAYYELLANSNGDPILEGHKTFTPCYFGTVETDKASLIKLEDLTSSFDRPCVLDLKVGRVTYDPLADSEKIKVETSKYSKLQPLLGFSILGTKYFDKEKRQYVTLDKYSCRETEVNEVSSLIGKYLSSAKDPAVIVEGFLKSLATVKRWFETQTSYCFYSSSLLFIYESGDSGRVDVSGIRPSCFVDHSQVRTENTDVRHIDFAHAFAADGPDENFIFGLTHIIRIFEEIGSSKRRQSGLSTDRQL